jgi:hypothetical protein
MTLPYLTDPRTVHGNLSYVTPRISSTATSTVASGLGAYILAALGHTPTHQADTTTTPSHTAAASSRASSHASSIMQTLCYPGGGQCWTDVYYTSPTIPSTGTGASYATLCSNAQSSYSSASTSWSNKHVYTTGFTDILGGTMLTTVTYYANATTLCDGHARVNYSPAIATSSTTYQVVTATTQSVGTASLGYIFPVSAPSCSIGPSDCDGLWRAYSTGSLQWNARNATRASGARFPTITASPSVPPCVNSSQSMSDAAFSKSFYGCGVCTIFGDEVQLIYFPEPTTVSRDLCATTPSANLTSYGNDDGVPYTGAGLATTLSVSGTPKKTAVVGNHTFTTGTAYISIKNVWAIDRCNSTIGSTVTDAVLALPSNRLLSLRYSQDHYQHFATTDKVTGYPFNFADLNPPVPYSAYNGQAKCQSGALRFQCNVIYENDYNPQLAMPPGIRKLNPAWEGCQMWYGGLYDPPYALKPGSAVADPTVAFGSTTATTTAAAQASSVAPTTARPTALSLEINHDQAETTQSADTTPGVGAPHTQAGVPSHDQDTPAGQTTQGDQAQHWNPTRAQNTEATTITNHASAITTLSVITKAVVITVGSKVETISGDQSGVVQIGSTRVTPGGPAVTLSGGSVVSAENDGIKVGTSVVKYSTITGAAVSAVVFTVEGSAVTAYQAAGTTGVATINGTVLSQGGPAVTLFNGEVISMGPSGLVVHGASTVPTGAFTIMTGSRSRSSSGSTTGISSTRTEQQTQSTVTSTATRTSGAGSIIHHLSSTKTSLLTVLTLSVSPLLFAIYL